MARTKNYEIDMCRGPIVSKMILFAVPLMLSGMLQLCYQAADVIVVGQFAGTDALAAVGSTGSLTNLLVNIFMGLALGASITVSRYYGKGDNKAIFQTVHTAIAIGAIAGVLVGAFGIIMARPLLTLMGTPDNIMDATVLYLRLYFVGMPANLIYNFGSGILRAVGDTRRPLYFLTFAGIINVILNLIFVIVFNMSVAGVALATIAAQIISCVLVIRCLMHSTDAPWHLNVKEIKIYKEKLYEIARVGIPAGVQGSLFAIANVMIQSSLNSFGSLAMAASAASSSLESFIGTACSSISQTVVTFASQNMGAKQYSRVKKGFLRCFFMSTSIGLVLGWTLIFFGPSLLKLYDSDPEVIALAMEKLTVIAGLHFICSMMDIVNGQLRGMGYAVIPMIISILGVCVFRIIWILTIFAEYRTLTTLYLSFPASWAITGLASFICYMYIKSKLPKEDGVLA